MSNAVSARVERLNMPVLRAMEKHGRREDRTAIARKVRDVPSLAWSSDPLADPLALVDRYEDHVRGALVPKSRSKALHMIVKLPDTVPVGTEAEARAAMMLAVDFAQTSLGGRAVFAARIDRDERTTRSVDVFLAPVYEKTTARQSKPAVSMTRHLKLLAEAHGRTDDGKSARSSMVAQGQALQDALVAFLRRRGVAADRGQPKAARGSDWRTPEELGAAHDREAAEQARQEAQDALRVVGERSRVLDGREQAVRAASAALATANDLQRGRTATLDARERVLEGRERSIGDREAKVADVERDAAEAAKRQAVEATRARTADLDQRERVLAGDRARLNLAVVRHEAKRRELSGLAKRLAALVEPVRRAVDAWRASIGVTRQALEPRGRAAEAVLEEPAIADLAQIAQRLDDLGR